MKLVGSVKLDSGCERDKKKETKKKKNPVKHERRIVILLIFEFE